jgi:hypothetical protein
MSSMVAFPLPLHPGREITINGSSVTAEKNYKRYQAKTNCDYSVFTCFGRGDILLLIK